MYWYARIILNLRGVESSAFSSGIAPDERRAISRMTKRRTYARLRASGLSYHETRARMDGCSLSTQKARYHAMKRAWRKRWGGEPGPGTQAFNRWILAR